MAAVGHQLIRAKLPDGNVVRIQALATGSTEEDVSALQKVLDFDGVVASVQSISKAMTQAVAHAKPDTASVEFGVDVGVESGGLSALLVKGTGSATVRITLEWSPGAGGGVGEDPGAEDGAAKG